MMILKIEMLAEAKCQGGDDGTLKEKVEARGKDSECRVRNSIMFFTQRRRWQVMKQRRRHARDEARDETAPEVRVQPGQNIMLGQVLIAPQDRCRKVPREIGGIRKLE